MRLSQRPSVPLLRFLGATDTVKWSRFLIDTSRARVLVDCGLFQGLKAWRLHNWEPFPVDPATLDALLLTHAHIDHTGYVPALACSGFCGHIFATAGTCNGTVTLSTPPRRLEPQSSSLGRYPGIPLMVENPSHGIEVLDTGVNRLPPRGGCISAQGAPVAVDGNRGISAPHATYGRALIDAVDSVQSGWLSERTQLIIYLRIKQPNDSGGFLVYNARRQINGTGIVVRVQRLLFWRRAERIATVMNRL